MSAAVEASGVTRQLDSNAQPDEQVTSEQAKDPARLARILMRLIKDVVAIKGKWQPQTIDHRDRAVDGSGTTIYAFPHNFGGRVNWWPVDWTGATAGPRLVRQSSSTDNTLILVSYTAGTVSLRIEAAG